MKLVPLLSLLLFASGSAHAALQIGRHVDLYMVTTCTQYAQYRTGTEGSHALMGYVAGWLSATNMFGDQKYSVSDADAVARAVSWLDGFCVRHPKSGLQEGLFWFSQHGATASEPDEEIAPRPK